MFGRPPLCLPMFTEPRHMDRLDARRLVVVNVLLDARPPVKVEVKTNHEVDEPSTRFRGELRGPTRKRAGDLSLKTLRGLGDATEHGAFRCWRGEVPFHRRGLSDRLHLHGHSGQIQDATEIRRPTPLLFPDKVQAASTDLMQTSIPFRLMEVVEELGMSRYVGSVHVTRQLVSKHEP